MPTVVIAAGGTAGHVVPAIAVADALRARKAKVSFVGTRERAEAELVPAAGYEIDFLRLSGIDRRNPLRATAAAGRAAAAVASARRALRRRGADVVMGGGGYVAGPAGLAARTLGIPLVLTEADSHLGLANRLLAPRAQRVCLAFPIPGRDDERYLVTGRPVPEAILGADRGEARRRYGIAEEDRCLLVFGGSLGARSINEVAVRAFARPIRPDPDSGRDFHVLHIAGKRDFAHVRLELESGGVPPRYTLLEYEPHLGDPLAACDLVLARAGGSIFEIAAAGRPAVLVPYPHATGDHQTRNAEWMSDGGAAEVIADAELTPERIGEDISRLLDDRERLSAMSEAAASLARPDAAEAIAAEVLSVAKAGGRRRRKAGGS